MAFLYRLKHDDDSAEKLFSKALELDPEDPAPYASLASLYLTANREEEALQMLLKANELNDNIAIVHADMAVCYARMGHFANAEEELEIAQELHVDNFNLFKQEIDALKDLAQ
jgi:Flp pilus assembly protein TadD